MELCLIENCARRVLISKNHLEHCKIGYMSLYPSMLQVHVLTWHLGEMIGSNILQTVVGTRYTPWRKNCKVPVCQWEICAVSAGLHPDHDGHPALAEGDQGYYGARVRDARHSVPLRRRRRSEVATPAVVSVFRGGHLHTVSGIVQWIWPGFNILLYYVEFLPVFWEAIGYDLLSTITCR